MASGKSSSRKPSGVPLNKNSSAGKPSGAGSSARPGSSVRSGSSTRSGATASRSGATTTAKRPPSRKPGRTIVNQRQTPWGMIATAVVLVLFAAGIVIYAVTRNGGSSTPAAAGASSSAGMAASKNNKRYELSALPAAMKIKGVTYHVEPNHNHVTGTVSYDASPPIGGNHSQIWANCSGTVYDHQIANENAVHMLEHGAVWITYNPDTIAPGDLAKLKTDVQGIDRLALSPYAGLKTPISLQAWGYQLFVQHANDPRIGQFIDALRDNPKTTPELGASCSDPYFDASKSTPGHPQDY